MSRRKKEDIISWILNVTVFVIGLVFHEQIFAFFGYTS